MLVEKEARAFFWNQVWLVGHEKLCLRTHFHEFSYRVLSGKC